MLSIARQLHKTSCPQNTTKGKKENDHFGVSLILCNRLQSRRQEDINEEILVKNMREPVNIVLKQGFSKKNMSAEGAEGEEAGKFIML